jgi:hypothetical protein
LRLARFEFFPNEINLPGTRYRTTGVPELRLSGYPRTLALDRLRDSGPWLNKFVVFEAPLINGSPFTHSPPVPKLSVWPTISVFLFITLALLLIDYLLVLLGAKKGAHLIPSDGNPTSRNSN